MSYCHLFSRFLCTGPVLSFQAVFVFLCSTFLGSPFQPPTTCGCFLCAVGEHIHSLLHRSATMPPTLREAKESLILAQLCRTSLSFPRLRLIYVSDIKGQCCFCLVLSHICSSWIHSDSHGYTPMISPVLCSNISLQCNDPVQTSWLNLLVSETLCSLTGINCTPRIIFVLICICCLFQKMIFKMVDGNGLAEV